MRKYLVALSALLLAAPVQAEWHEARTERFIVYSDSSVASTREFAEKLARFDLALRSLQTLPETGPVSDSERVTVFRFGDTSDIARIYGDASSGVAGFYVPRAGGSSAFVPARERIKRTKGASSIDRIELDSQTVLFHEYAHHFMFQYFPAAYPGWYIEGFAELYSTVDFKDDGSFHLGNPPQARGDELFDNRYFVGNLLSDRRPDGEDFYNRYSLGWLLSHYLTFEPSREGQLVRFLKAVNAGKTNEQAAREVFGDFRKLDADMRRYLAGRLPGALVKPGHYRAPVVTIRTLDAAEEATMRPRMRLARTANKRQARDIAADARASLRDHPGSLPILLTLAEAELAAGQHAEAATAADRALAMDPSAHRALLVRGMAAIEAGAADPTKFAEARSWLAKAQRADRNDPAPLLQNYLSYYKAGGAIPENALIGLERAYEKAPFDDDLRLILVRQLLRENKGKIAGSLLAPLALSPHESRHARALREVLDLVEANQIADAQAKLAARMAAIEVEREKRD